MFSLCAVAAGKCEHLTSAVVSESTLSELSHTCKIQVAICQSLLRGNELALQRQRLLIHLLCSLSDSLRVLCTSSFIEFQVLVVAEVAAEVLPAAVAV